MPGRIGTDCNMLEVLALSDRVVGRLSTEGTIPPETTEGTLLVGVGAGPQSPRVIATAKILADSLAVPWVALGVERPIARQSGHPQMEVLSQNLRLAGRLGAETATVIGPDVAKEIVAYSRAHGVTKIVVGRTSGPLWRRLTRRSVSARVLRLSGDIDTYLVRAEAVSSAPAKATRPRKIPWMGYLWALVACVVASLVAWGFQSAGMVGANEAIVYLLAVAIVSARYGLGPGVVTTVIGELSFHFFFVPYRLSFVLADGQFVTTILLMLGVALIISTLSARLRAQSDSSRAKEERLEALYRLSKELSGAAGKEQVTLAAQREVSRILGSQVTVYLPDERAHLEAVGSGSGGMAASLERAAAEWALANGRPAGRGTDKLPEAKGLYLPMTTSHGIAGVLCIESELEGTALLPDNQQLLDTLAPQIGIALERDEYADKTRWASLQIERERLRSSLLSSVSHDLRTPLAVIAGASSALLELKDSTDSAQREALLQEVVDESSRLARLVDNLLSMTRLDSGAIEVDKQWFPLEDVIGSALGRLRNEIDGRAVKKQLAPDLPPLPLDGVLLEQVFVNLLENALKYSPPGSPIDIAAGVDGHEVIVQVGDRGPGLAPGEEQTIFEKLYRGSASTSSREPGAGLGLAIAEAIVVAHGGRIWAENRPGGGASFSFALPLGDSPPDVIAMEQEESGT